MMKYIDQYEINDLVIMNIWNKVKTSIEIKSKQCQVGPIPFYDCFHVIFELNESTTYL